MNQLLKVTALHIGGVAHGKYLHVTASAFRKVPAPVQRLQLADQPIADPIARETTPSDFYRREKLRSREKLRTGGKESIVYVLDSLSPDEALAMYIELETKNQEPRT